MRRRAAWVCLDGERVGRLDETDDGVRFAYLAEWVAREDATPVSLTLPLGDGPWTTPRLHPAFANLLPEGWLLELSVARLKVAADDEFGLLLACCRDTIGVIEVLPVDGGQP